MTLQTRRPVTDRPFHRSKHTYKFVREHLQNKGVVLDIGDVNYVGQFVSKLINMEVINTESDLNYDISPYPPQCNIVFCFEVIEHLMNPALFLVNLGYITTSDVQLFLSYPSRPKLLWNNRDHFHEYDSMRFRYLLNQTGWTIINHSRIRIINTWTDYLKYFKGFRPLLRLFYDFTEIYEIRKG